jgi:hypothetical protein
LVKGRVIERRKLLRGRVIERRKLLRRKGGRNNEI